MHRHTSLYLAVPVLAHGSLFKGMPMVTRFMCIGSCFVSRAVACQLSKIWLCALIHARRARCECIALRHLFSFA